MISMPAASSSCSENTTISCYFINVTTNNIVVVIITWWGGGVWLKGTATIIIPVIILVFFFFVIVKDNILTTRLFDFLELCHSHHCHYYHCCCPCMHRSKHGCRGQCNGYRTLLWKLLGRQTTDFWSILHTSKAKHHTNNTNIAKHWDIDAFTCCYKII